MNRKGQMEILGLVFIVFLLALGMFFMVSVTRQENIESLSVSPQNINLAQNMIDALKNINVECPPIKRKVGLDELIQDFASYNPTIWCNGTRSINYASDIINTTLQMTLAEWKKPYSFKIAKIGEDPLINFTYLNCTEFKPGDQGYQPFPLRRGGGTVVMTLYICA